MRQLEKGLGPRPGPHWLATAAASDSLAVRGDGHAAGLYRVLFEGKCLLTSHTLTVLSPLPLMIRLPSGL